MSENCDSCSLNMKALAPPGTMWPYEVPITTVDETERTVTSYAKRWIGFTRCLRDIDFYDKGVLELPLTSLTLSILINNG